MLSSDNTQVTAGHRFSLIVPPYCFIASSRFADNKATASLLVSLLSMHRHSHLSSRLSSRLSSSCSPAWHRAHAGPSKHHAYGYSLLELLIVVSLLATIAAVGTQVFFNNEDSVERQTQRELIMTELRSLANATRRFQQDTGYLPGQGPFPARAHSADWQQLLVQPNGPGGPIMPWQIDVGRGWNGPYLSANTEGRVTIGSNLQLDGSGNPEAGALITVFSMADSVIQERAPGTALAWQATANNIDVVRGAPILLFSNAAANANVLGCLAPCVLSFGLNGIYEQGNGDDVVLSF